MNILICDTTGMVETTASDQIVRNSPISCMQAEYDNHFDLIVIVMRPKKIRERNALLELCYALKEGEKSRTTPLLVLLPAKHRSVLEHLQKAGVDFVAIVDWKTMSAEQLSRIMHHLNDSRRPLRILKGICPYIHYQEIDNRRELALCTADRCRLVLGPTRLAGLCEIPDHVYCPYFKEPKFPGGQVANATTETNG
ncbi:MAG TPA: hypothetical protein ENO25_06165 [Desulfobacteraceae bacterium]|nr:hypothetical protein [Desulfobacteraceae bacterium]